MTRARGCLPRIRLVRRTSAVVNAAIGAALIPGSPCMTERCCAIRPRSAPTTVLAWVRVP